MEKLRKGYKQTDIGVIPEDWEVVEIGNYINVNTGSKNTQDKIAEGQFPFYVRSQNIENINNYSFDCEAVLTAGDGVGTGKVFHYINGKFEAHQRVYIMNSFGDRLDGKYFFYYFSSNFYNRIMQMTAKSSVDSVRKEMITEMQIPLSPTLAEQKAIAEVLSDIDSLIEALDKRIAKKRAIKEGTMQQLLTGKKRLRGFTEPWKEKKIKKIGKLLSSGIDKKNVEGEEPIRLVNYLDVFHNDKIYSSMLSHWVTASKEKIDQCAVRKGDIYFTPSSEMPFDIAISAVAMEDINDAGYSYHIVCLRLYEDIKLNYRAYMFKQKQFIEQAENLCEGSGKRYVISLAKFKEMTIKYPSNTKEQQAIAQILTDMDNEIEQLEKERQKYIALKQGAMQKLLTGQIRLSIVNQTRLPKKSQKQANVHFKRSVWAAEIADRLCDEPTFGHVKMEKLLFLTEHICGVDIGSNYHRDVAGPYDNRAIRSIDSQLKKQNWFEVVRRDMGYRYIPLTKRGGHKDYFDKYYSGVLSVFEKVINTFRSWNTERCEIVATLYSAWKDFENAKQQYTDNDIINEVINNWNESKKRISEERWQKALDWMREKGFTPIKT